MYRKLAGMTGTADTSLRIPGDLRPGSGRHPDPYADGARRSQRPGLPHCGRKYRRSSPTSRLLRTRTAGARRHDLDREFRADLGHAAKDKLPHQVLNANSTRAKAEIVARAGRPKVITIATNMAGRGTDIVLGATSRSRSILLREKEDVGARGEGASQRCAANGRTCTTRSSQRAASTSSVPSGTRRAASTTSCAGARAGRATRVPHAFSSRWKIRFCGSSPAIGSTPSWSAWGCPKASRSSTAS